MSRVALAKDRRTDEKKFGKSAGEAAEYLASEKKWSQNIGMLAALAVPMIVSSVFTGGAALPLWAGMLSAGGGYLAGAKLGEEAREAYEEGGIVWGEDKHSKGETIHRGKFFKEETREAVGDIKKMAQQTDKDMLTNAGMAAAMYGVKEIGGSIKEGMKATGSEKLIGKEAAMKAANITDEAVWEAKKSQASWKGIKNALTESPDPLTGKISKKAGKHLVEMNKHDPDALKGILGEDKYTEFVKGIDTKGLKTPFTKKGAYAGDMTYGDLFTKASGDEAMGKFTVAEGIKRGELQDALKEQFKFEIPEEVKPKTVDINPIGGTEEIVTEIVESDEVIPTEMSRADHIDYLNTEFDTSNTSITDDGSGFHDALKYVEDNVPDAKFNDGVFSMLGNTDFANPGIDMLGNMGNKTKNKSAKTVFKNMEQYLAKSGGMLNEIT